MKVDTIIRTVTKYRAALESMNVENMAYPHWIKVESSERVLSHCYSMLDDIETFAKNGKIEKAFRWLGFVQGCFWSVGLYNIYDLRNDNTD